MKNAAWNGLQLKRQRINLGLMTSNQHRVQSTYPSSDMIEVFQKGLNAFYCEEIDLNACFGFN